MAWNVWNTALAQWENLTSFKRYADAVGFCDLVTQEGREGGPFQVRKTGSVLEEHGTKLMQLKPSMIWRCAMDDLDRRAHNKNADVTGMKHYAFHRKHVAKASTANDILRAAIDQPGLGQASNKKDTRLLYSDVELLKAALR